MGASNPRFRMTKADVSSGHALNKILKDIINRFHMSMGRKVQCVRRSSRDATFTDLHTAIFLDGTATGFQLRTRLYRSLEYVY